MNRQHWLIGTFRLIGWLLIVLIPIAAIYSQIQIYIGFRDATVPMVIKVELLNLKWEIRMFLWGLSIVAGTKIMVLIKEGCLKK